MKLNAKIMLLVCIGLMVCVSAVSACHPSISIDKKTNGDDGLDIIEGTPIIWTYDLQNTGEAALDHVHVTDSKGVTVICPKTTLAIGETMTCTASGFAEPVPYSNTGTAHGKYSGDWYTACDDSDYNGIPANPQIAIDKVTNGADGLTIAVGTPITWTYTVTNTGNVPLTAVAVTDDKVAPVTCLQTTLAAGESMICTATGTAVEGAYSNTGTATGNFGNDPVVPATANDGSTYTGTVEGGSSGSSVPEFPSVALPAAFIVGLVGVVLFIKGNRDNE